MAGKMGRPSPLGKGEAPQTGAPELGWDAVGKAVGVAAVLLPATGVGVRWVSFQFQPQIPSVLAVRAPISELAATGFLAIAVAIPIVLGLAFYFQAMAPVLFTAKALRDELQTLQSALASAAPPSEGDLLQLARLERIRALESLRSQLEVLAPDEIVPPVLAAEWKALEANVPIQERPMSSTPENGSGRAGVPLSDAHASEIRGRLNDLKGPGWLNLPRGTRLRRAALALALVTWLAVIALAPGFPAVYLNFVGSFLAVILLRRAAERQGKVALVEIVPAVLIVATFAAIAYGLQPSRGGPVARVEFSDPTIRDGSYVFLGSEAATTYLRSCRNGEVLGIHDTSMRLVAYQALSAESPSLWSVVTRHQGIAIGATLRC